MSWRLALSLTFLLEFCVALTTSILDDPHSLLRVSDASPPSPYASNGRENPDDVSNSFPVVVKVQQKVAADAHADDVDVFSVPYVSGFIATQLLCGVKCDACKACLTSQVILSTSVFIYFKEYSDTEQSVTYPEKLVETVSTSVTLLKTMMVELAYLNSLEHHVSCHQEEC
jgi:hypothetical protein